MEIIFSEKDHGGKLFRAAARGGFPHFNEKNSMKSERRPRANRPERASRTDARRIPGGE
ncbi:hypothetical protein HMPREF7215_2352 [Pyramidobacter piscolens W5455]|uniref:Uncharacterized protein n=1 Tax=Pyramidobacter piscolens W5455 TaxID=352165 RepID=A0ABM9ZUM1_9BACT|nr:hypothetical protein HMPREF7215_2352 [Pyramidobacter piscolens W5455]